MPLSKEEEKAQWKELCSYVKKNILRYDDSKTFPKSMALRLKGLAQGRDYPDKAYAKIYTYDFLKKVFICLQPTILEIVERTWIKDEEHLVNLIMKVTRNNFNDVIDRYNKEVRRKREMDKIDLSQIVDTTKVNYVRKSAKKIKNDW